jgi:hypothetical protein
VQVDHIKPAMKEPGTKRLKLISDELLLNLAFNFYLRRYIMALAVACHRGGYAHDTKLAIGRGLHSSTFELILSRF